jgi:hypothetical protein
MSLEDFQCISSVRMRRGGMAALVFEVGGKDSEKVGFTGKEVIRVELAAYPLFKGSAWGKDGNTVSLDKAYGVAVGFPTNWNARPLREVRACGSLHSACVDTYMTWCAARYAAVHALRTSVLLKAMGTLLEAA